MCEKRWAIVNIANDRSICHGGVSIFFCFMRADFPFAKISQLIFMYRQNIAKYTIAWCIRKMENWGEIGEKGWFDLIFCIFFASYRFCLPTYFKLIICIKFMFQKNAYYSAQILVTLPNNCFQIEGCNVP